MRFDIRFKGTERSGAIVEHVRRRTRFALAHLAERIRSIVIRFEDVNGPKSGVDKHCRVDVDGPFGACAFETRDVDFYVAADRALELCERAIQRDRARHDRTLVDSRSTTRRHSPQFEVPGGRLVV